MFECDAAAINQRNDTSLNIFPVKCGNWLEITCNIDYCFVTIVNQKAVEL